MENVVDAGCAEDLEGGALVDRARQGEKAALEALIRRHQGWIYNIAMRMVGPDDAEDVSQEIFIKLITKLSTFQGRSGFRTWLCRIVVNHMLTMKRRPWERMFSSFDRQSDLIDSLELADLGPAEQEVLVHETKAGCMSGMLLCLDRSERIAMVLGVIFGAGSELGGELLETSSENYRQILSRARDRLGNFMDGKCGLMNRDNPCRCERKTRAAIKAGLVDPEKRRFDIRYLGRVREFVDEKAGLLDDALSARLRGVFRDQGFYESPDLVRMLDSMLNRGDFGRIMDFV